LAKNVKVFAMQSGLQAGLEWITQFKQLQLDAPLDNVDMDDFFRKALIAAGVPHTSIMELKQRDQMRQMKEQMMQQQMQMEQLQQASEIQRNMGGRSNMNNAQGVNQ
jgi:predicted aconitase